MIFINKENEIESNSKEESTNRENQVVQEISNSSAITIYNVSIDNEIMAGIQKITNKYNEKNIREFYMFRQLGILQNYICRSSNTIVAYSIYV